MPFSFSGYAAGGAQDELQQLFKKRIEEEAARAAEEQRLLENERVEREMRAREDDTRYKRGRDVVMDKRYETEQEFKERERRDRINAEGVASLERQGPLMIAQAQEQRANEAYQRELGELERFQADESIPQSARTLAGLGVMPKGEEDLLPFDERNRRAGITARTTAEATAAGTAAGRDPYERIPVREWMVEPNTGLEVPKDTWVYGRDAARGKEIGDTTPGGGGGGAGGAGGARGRGAEATASSARTQKFIQLIADQSAAINTMNVPDNITKYWRGPQARLEGSIREILGDWGIDPTVKTYVDLVEAFTPIIARAIGHVGVLTEQDVRTAQQSLPMPGMTAHERAKKLNDLAVLVSGMTPEMYASLPMMPGLAAQLGIEANVDRSTPSASYRQWQARGGRVPMPQLPGSAPGPVQLTPGGGGIALPEGQPYLRYDATGNRRGQ